MYTKVKFLRNLLITASIAAIGTSSANTCAAQDTITTATGQTNTLSVPGDWTVLGVPGIPPNNDPASTIFVTQDQDLNFDINIGNIGTVNLYGYQRNIYINSSIALQGIINDTGAPMIARVTAANGGVPLAPGAAGPTASTNIYIINDFANLNFTGNQIDNVGGIYFNSPNSSVQFSADNTVFAGKLNAPDFAGRGNGIGIVNALNVQLNGTIGDIDAINGLQIRDNASATLNESASFQAGGINFDYNSELTVAAGSDITFANGAQINFNGNGILRLQGDQDRFIDSNIVSNNNNGTIIYEGTTTKTLSLTGDIGNSGSNIGLMDITTGGTLKLSTNFGSEMHIDTIDMGPEDGTLILNHLGLYLNNFFHANDYGTVIISDSNTSNNDAATVGINNNILGSAGNPIKKIQFENSPCGALVNVVVFGMPINIYAGSIETDTAGKGVFVFGGGYNIVDAPIGTASLPLLALAINNDTTVELRQDVFLNQQLLPIGYEIELSPGSIVKIAGNVTADIGGVDTVLSSTPIATTNGTIEFINTAPVTLTGNIATLDNVNILGAGVSVIGDIETQNLNFNSDSPVGFLGNVNRTLETSNINANNIGAIIANDIAFGNSLTIIGNVGNPSGKLRLIEAKGGGAVIFNRKITDTDPRNVSVERIDITTNDGTLEFNGGEHSGFILDHDNHAGTIVINSGPQGSFTQFNAGISLSSSANRLKKLLFRSAVGAPFNVLAFPGQTELYIDAIETDTHDSGVLLFGAGNNLIDAPIGVNLNSLHAIALINPNVSLELRQDAYVGGLGLYAAGSVMKIKGNVYTNDNVLLGGGIFGIDYADISTVIKGVKGTAQFINTAPVTFDGEISYLDNVEIAGSDVTIMGPAEAREFNFSSSAPATLRFREHAVIHTNGAATASNNLHNIVFENNADVNADIGALSNKFNNIRFANDLTKIANIRSNIYATAITANNSALSIQTNAVMTGGINSNNLNLDFSDNQLIYEGSAIFAGNAVFNTNFVVEQSGNYHGGGLVLIGNNSSFDFSAANTRVILNANSPTPSTGNPYSFTLFDQNAGQVSQTNVTLEAREINRFVAWSYNPTTHVLTGTRNVTLVDDIINAGGDINAIAMALGLSEAEVASLALLIQNELGLMSIKEATEALGRLVPFDVSGTALAEAADLVEKNNTRRISNQLVEIFSSGTGISAGDAIENLYGAWISPFYSKTTQKSFSLEPGYKTRSYGGTVGVDTMLNEDWSLGASMSAIHTNVNHTDLKGPDKGRSRALLFSIYGFRSFTSEIFLQGIGFVGFNKLKNTQRRSITSNLTLNAHSKYNSLSYGGQLLTGKQFKLEENTAITPMLGLRYTHSRDDAYKETGASIQNLTVGRRLYNSLEGILGGKVFMTTKAGDFIIKPEFQAYLNYNLRNKPVNVDVSIDGFVKPVRIKSNKPSKAWYSLGTGVNFVKHNILYGIAYEAELDKKYIGHQAMLRLKVSL